MVDQGYFSDFEDMEQEAECDPMSVCSSGDETGSGGSSSSSDGDSGGDEETPPPANNKPSRRSRRWHDQRIERLKRRIKRHEEAKTKRDLRTITGADNAKTRRTLRRRKKPGTASADDAEEENGRIGENVYEAFQVQAYAKMRETVLFKTDTGANVTLVDRILYDHGLRHGYIRRDRLLRRPLAVKGIAGRTACRRVGEMMIMFPGSEVPVAIQVYPTYEPMDRAHQVLLGTDNLDMLGAVVDRCDKKTTYKRVPGRSTSVVSEHLNPTAAQRQFIAHRVGCDETEAAPAVPKVPGDGRGKHEGVDPEDRRWKGQECLIDEVVAENKDRYNARYCEAEEAELSENDIEVTHVNRHFRKIERAVARGDRVAALSRLRSLVSFEADADDEYSLLDRAARENEVEAEEGEGGVDIADSSKHLDPTTSIMIDVGKDGKADLNRKSQGDTAGTGWVKATKEQIKMHVIAKSDCMEDGRYIPDRFIDAYHNASQPPTEHLPAITNHYVYVRLKPDAPNFKAGFRNVPHALLGRLKKIIQSMVDLDVIAPTDTAVNTMPITLVLGKNEKGETTISRFCIDARQLNSALLDTTTECLPNMNEVLKHVAGAYVMSTTDACKAFWSQRIYPPDRAKCAINVAGSNYVLKRLFFGLKTGTSQHNQLMTEIIGDDILWHEDSGVALYCDDCAIYTKKRDGESHDDVMHRHFELLTIFMERLAKRNVTVSVKKSHIAMGKKGIDFLGYHLARDGMSIQEHKKAAIVSAPFPATAKALHTFIGAAVFLQRALNCNLSELLAPLRKYVVMSSTTKKYILKYDPTVPEVISAVTVVKERIANSCTLVAPDYGKEFFLFVDGAQSSGVGGVLTQFVDTGPPEDPVLTPTGGKKKYSELDRVIGLDKPNRRLPSEQTEPPAPIDPVSGKRRVGYFAPLGFYSKSLQRHHKKWTSLDVELYAIVASFRHFEHMILGCKTTVMSDCKAIEFLHKHKDGNGRVSRWFNYLSQFEYSVTHVKGVSNGLSDYLSRNPIDDPLNTGDGELFRDKLLTNQRGELQFTEHNVPVGWMDSANDEAEVAAAEAQVRARPKKPTLYSVCSGIGSSMQAVEQYGLDVEVLGCCENDKDTAEVLEKLYPEVPNHGDLRDVISALEAGEMVLRPDIVEISVPCQGRSVARRLAEWADELHPHHNLWKLQAKLVSLTRPKVVLMENVPWRDEGPNPTKQQYVKLRQDLEQLGYHVQEDNSVNCASHGDHTARERYFAVANRQDVAPFQFPEKLTRYEGLQGILEPDDCIRRKIRCHSRAKECWVKGKGSWKKPGASPFAMEQIGFINPESEKEFAFQQRMRTRFPGIRNFKGFRVYSTDSPMPTIMRWGKEEFCGPGKNTQFIVDANGYIRLLTVTEAARCHSFCPRVIDELAVMNETLAYGLIGNSVPVATMGAFLRQAIEAVLKGLPAVEVASAEAREEAAVIQTKLDKLRLPTLGEVCKAQKKDSEVSTWRSQLQVLLGKGGAAELRKKGVDAARIMALSQYSFDEMTDVLMHAPTLPHYYVKGVPCDDRGKPLSATETREQRMESMIVLPKVLQQDVCYLHHYSRGCAHPQWYDLVKQINEAGYTWRGMKTTCMQLCGRCRVCYRATRTKTYNSGLFTARRFRRPFEAVSWDFQNLGTSSDSGKCGLLTLLCEHTGFCELYAADAGDATAEFVADCLVQWSLRWGLPETAWGGQDVQMSGEVIARVCERLGIKCMSSTAYNKNAIAKQERKHKLINSVLRRLHEGHPNSWDQHLSLVEYRLRNTTHLRSRYSPWQMVFGRVPRMPSNLRMEQSKFRKHPRAEKYINGLNQTLGSIWREVDMAGVLASQESFGALNAGRKPAKYKVGDYVYHYQPKTDPDGAPTKMLIPWVGPWRIEQVVRAKDVKMRHIDTGVEEEVHTSTIIPAPEEEEPGDYNDRYSLVRHLEDVPDRLPRAHQLQMKDFVVVRSEGRYSVGRVQEAYSDGSAHLLWWNSRDGKCTPTQKWYRAYQDRDAELGEKFVMKGDPKKRLWDLVSRANMVQTFKWPSRERQDTTPVMLPQAIRKFFGSL